MDFLESESFNTTSLASKPYSDIFREAEFWIDALEYAPDGTKMTEDRLFTGNETGTDEGDAAYFAKFASVQCDQAFSNDARVTIKGNPFFEEGVMRPDRILLDLVTMFHPEVFPNTDSSLYFYRRLTATSNPAYVEMQPTCRITFTHDKSSHRLEKIFAVDGMDPALIHNVIPYAFESKVASSLQIEPISTDIYVLADSKLSTQSFNLLIALSVGEDQVDIMASRMESRSNSIVDALKASVKEFKDRYSESLTYLKTEFPESVAVSPEAGIKVTIPDGSSFYWSENKGLSRAAIVGIVIGSIVAFLLILGGVSYAAYRYGTRRAYHKMRSIGSSLELSAADVEKKDSTILGIVPEPVQ